MDIQIPFIFVSLFSLASVMLIFIYKFGIKEKSYEEARAEQRQHTQILLGTKSKSKEKKSKKLTKKVMEKSSSESENINNSEKSEIIDARHNINAQKKPHVEFKEIPEELTVPKDNIVSKKQTKKEKVRSILVRKEEKEIEITKNIVTDDIVSPPLNHFEELHPKDDFELFKSNEHSENDFKEESDKYNKCSKAEVDVNKFFIKKEVEVALSPPQEENNPPAITTPMNGIVNNSGKEKKRKKGDSNVLEQLVTDTNRLNITVLLKILRNAELSRSEVQILIDLLLNKQHETLIIMDEWSEGKSDPVQKLKKQLAEKEKLLSEEQQLVSSTQLKLREIRTEHQTEKTKLHQKIRSLDEALQGKQVEANRLHQQLQQLQAQLKEEVLNNHKLREELTTIQLQRQQIEIRLAQTQESEVMLTRLQNETQELSSLNNQLRLELTRITEESRAEKECQQTFIVQLNNLQKEIEQVTEHNRQLEESRSEVERNLEQVINHENDLTSEISRLNNHIQQQNEEIRRLERGKKQYQDELQKHKDDSTKLINQLKMELQILREENLQMQAEAAHMNSSLQENKQHKVEILNLHNELTSTKTQLKEMEKIRETELKATNMIITNLQAELGELKMKLEEASSELEKQKIKNNELRTKNWKVMEALNIAEHKMKNNSQIKSEKDIQMEFIQRLFPEIKELGTTTSEKYEIDCQKYINKYIDDLRKKSAKESTEDMQQLKSQLQHYKNVIDNAERMLNRLQKHIEQEEINWRMQLASKTAELESFKESYASELQEKLLQLQKKLKEEQEDKSRIITQFQEFKTNYQKGQQKSLEVQHNCNPSNGLH